jgi:hypothetical protein
MSIDQRKRQKKLAKKKAKRKDYKISRQLLMDLDPNVCPNQYIFGKDGKPFYISGPNENQNQSKKIVEKLLRNCGEGNFDYIVSSFDESKIL